MELLFSLKLFQAPSSYLIGNREKKAFLFDEKKMYFPHCVSQTIFFRNNSQVSSRDVSPKTKSPTDSYFNFQSGTNSSLKSNKSSDDTSNHSANNITDIEVYDYDADMDVEHNTFRICVLGETGVGKTALVNQFLTSEHMNTYDSSLGK